jgi:hypothetical protein
VVIVRTAPVLVFVIVTVTFGTTLPLGSVTVPTIVASWAAAKKGNPNSNSKIKTPRLSQFPLAVKIEQKKDEDEEFIDIVSTPLDQLRTPLTYTQHPLSMLMCQAFFRFPEQKLQILDKLGTPYRLL